MSSSITQNDPSARSASASLLSAVALTPRADYDAAHVNKTFQQIRHTFEDGNVWKSELEHDAQAVGQLSPDERNSLVNLMAKDQSGSQSLLMRWMGEVTTGGIGPWGGLDHPQIQTLWENLVQGQDPANLERLFHAAKQGESPKSIYPNATGLDIEQPYQKLMAESVAKYGTGEQRVGFIGQLADNAEKGNLSAARSIGIVLGSLHEPKQVDQALSGLNRAATDAVVSRLITVNGNIGTNMFGGTTVHEQVDARMFNDVARSVASATNAREKGGFVASAGQLMKDFDKTMYGKEAIGQIKSTIASGMSAVIGSDINGVIDNTLLQNSREGHSNGRGALKEYASTLLDSGKGTHLGAIVLSLQRGNSLDQDPMQFLSQRQARTDDGPGYQHARVLGDWLGVVGSAVQSRISSREQNANVANMLFGVGYDSLKELVGAVFPPAKPPLGLVSIVAKPIVSTAITNWRTELARDDRSFTQSLYEAALPHHANGVEATADWVSTLNSQYRASLDRQ